MDTVFMKKPIKLKYDDIVKTIPKHSYNKVQIDLQHMLEYRWRFYNINNKKHIEISKIIPNTERRLYLIDKDRWEPLHINKFFDNYVTNDYYYYCEFEIELN
jgi:hypothetical protein